MHYHRFNVYKLWSFERVGWSLFVITSILSGRRRDNYKFCHVTLIILNTKPCNYKMGSNLYTYVRISMFLDIGHRCSLLFIILSFNWSIQCLLKTVKQSTKWKYYQARSTLLIYLQCVSICMCSCFFLNLNHQVYDCMENVKYLHTSWTPFRHPETYPTCI